MSKAMVMGDISYDAELVEPSLIATQPTVEEVTKVREEEKLIGKGGLTKDKTWGLVRPQRRS
jgi:hypothetical protein